jgi:hypothetical protein
MFVSLHKRNAHRLLHEYRTDTICARSSPQVDSGGISIREVTRESPILQAPDNETHDVSANSWR